MITDRPSHRLTLTHITAHHIRSDRIRSVHITYMITQDQIT